MKRVLGLAVLGLVLALPVLVRAESSVEGNWKLTALGQTGSTETTNFVLGLESRDGQNTAKVVAHDPQFAKVEVASFTMTGDKVRLQLKLTLQKAGKSTNGAMVFDGHITKDGKKFYGIVGQGVPAYMAPTDLKELDSTDIARKLPGDELQTWAEEASRLAREQNASWAVQINSKFADAFLAQKNTGLAVQYAFAAEKALDRNAAAEAQTPVLEKLAKALKAAGRDADLTAVTERLAVLEKKLDDAYLKEVPPFPGQRFAGRKAESDRVVVMELFTGAECPPCVAADVAFDVLQKTYRTSEVVLLQYHLHIPGPDPMTNSDTEARAAYYGARSTPSTFFNGANKAGGGGAMAAAEKKYNAYRTVIEPLLELPAAACKIGASAKRVGDKIQIKVDVTGMENPGKDMKLRMALVEETVKFVGGNKLRFHHQVVRAMPGTPAGVAVTEATQSWNGSIDLTDLRRQFVTYLDDFAANKRAFPREARPMTMDHMRLVAFIQDDASNNKEILQAVQVDVAK
jgi:hypothetical protein